MNEAPSDGLFQNIACITTQNVARRRNNALRPHLSFARRRWELRPDCGIALRKEGGDVVEIGEPACSLVATLATRIATLGGAALFIDYGPEKSGAGDSLQALRDGQNVDPLADPGGADLTAHVDFEALARAATGAAVHGPLAQGLFLTRLGLFQRTGVLARTLQPAAGAAMLDGARRLAEPDQMGRLFKVLCISHPALPEPPGFTA